MIRLRALTALILGITFFAGSAQAATINSLTYINPAVGSGIVYSNDSLSKATGSVDVMGYLAGKTQITFTYTYSGSGSFLNKTDVSLLGYGLTNKGFAGAYYADGSTYQTANNLVTIVSNLGANGGTITLTNYAKTKIFFLGVLDIVKKMSGSLTVAYNTSAVPLPAAFPLFALALGGMGFVAYRRKANGSL